MGSEAHGSEKDAEKSAQGGPLVAIAAKVRMTMDEIRGGGYGFISDGTVPAKYQRIGGPIDLT